MIRREWIPTSAIPIPSCVILACCRRLLGDTDDADCTDSFRYRSKSIVDERRGSMALNDKKILFHAQFFCINTIRPTEIPQTANGKWSIEHTLQKFDNRSFQYGHTSTFGEKKVDQPRVQKECYCSRFCLYV